MTRNLFSGQLNAILLLSNFKYNCCDQQNHLRLFFPYKLHKYCCHTCLTFVCYLQTLLDQDVFLLFTPESPSLLEQIPHKVHFETSVACIHWPSVVV